MTRKILDVGQCDADNYRISQMLSANFDVEVHRAHSNDEAITLATETRFDLVLINRLFDADGSPGLETLNQLKKLPDSTDVPVMIVSNFEEAQTAAVAAGAVQGFGKRAVDSPETVALLSKYLK